MKNISIIKDVFRKQYTLVVMLCIAVYCISYTRDNRWKGFSGEDWRTVIGSDGYGYYAYLPCIFIYHEFDFNKVIRSEEAHRPGLPDVEASYTFHTYPDGKTADKCFAGVALLMMPFFLIAYFLSSLLGYDTSGYSFIFEASISMAALFYMLAGLIFIRKLLKLYSIPEYIICIVILSGVFGTNLFYYATSEPSMGHTYSFGLTAIFLYYSKKSIDEKKLKYMALMVIAIGVLLIIRPTNLLSIFMIPFLAGTWKNLIPFISSIFAKYRFIILLGILALIVSIQITCWKIESGDFFLWSYPGETFVFSEFHFFDILFSYRKGWFVYTPLMFIAVAGGLIAFYRQNKYTFLVGLLFFTIVTYILSSWQVWWYGNSYGSRPFIDFYAAFLLFLAILFNSVRLKILKFSLFLLCCLCIGLNMLQIYQYYNFILLTDKMDKQKYWRLFLKSSNLYCGIFEYPDTTKYKFIDTLYFKNNFENNTWGNDKNLTTIESHSFSHSALMNSENNDSPTFTIKAARLKDLKNVSIFVKCWALTPGFNNGAILLVNVKDKKGNIKLWVWKSFQGFIFEKNKWIKTYFIFQLPEMNPDDIVSVLVTTTKGSIYIDDMEVTFGTPK